MILFDDVVEIFNLPQFTGVGIGSFRLQFVEGLWIGRVFLVIDYTRGGGMGSDRPWMFLSLLVKIKSGSLYQITVLFATEPHCLPTFQKVFKSG